MNQDWTLQGGNQKSPDTAKLQGHLALSMSNCLEIRRDTAEPDSWVESTSTPPLHSWPVWLSTSELTISSARIYCEWPLVVSKFASTMACVRNTHHHFTTPDDTIIRDRRLLQSQTLRWGCRHHKENESAKEKHTKTQQRSITVWNQT